jgi:RNA polymerase sigma factor for flagellar operon FliA
MESREGDGVEGQLVWVKAAARRLARRAGPAAEWDELYGWGAEGLVEAARSFDPERGVPFAAYARARVHGAMLDGMRAMSPMPLAVHRERVDAEDGDSGGEAHERLCARFASARAEGLLCDVAEETEGPIAAASPQHGPEAVAARRQLKRLVANALRALPDAEAEIVRRHALEEEPIERVATRLGIGSERARQLYQRALGRLRSRLRTTGHAEGS